MTGVSIMTTHRNSVLESAIPLINRAIISRINGAPKERRRTLNPLRGNEVPSEQNN